MKPKKSTASKKQVGARSSEPPRARQNSGARPGPAVRPAAAKAVEPIAELAPKATAAVPSASAASTPGKPSLKVPPILLEGDEPAAPLAGGPGQRYALGPASAPEHLGTSGE